MYPFRLSKVIVERAFDPVKWTNALFFKTKGGAEYLRLREKFTEISRKIVFDRKEELLNNPDILKDTKNLSFLDFLLTVK